MLLILREEIICLVILTFLLFYYATNKIKEKGKYFFRLIGIAMAHVLFDIVTILTVNHRDIVPDPLNRLAHILFYLAGILFAYQFYVYTLRICALFKRATLMTHLGAIPLLIFSVFLLGLPMEYVEGNGTHYSYGPLAFLGYGVFFFYCIVILLLLLCSRKKIEPRVQWAIIPMIFAMCLSVLAQMLIPELLMTSAAITFVCIGMFVALDNPDKAYKEQALWDFLTGLKNRNCFDKDLTMYHERFAGKQNRRRIGFLIADLNYLKIANDKYGHAEGDRLLSAAADALRDHLKQAEHIYRIGGDEFVAIYLSPNDNAVADEIEAVYTACAENRGLAVPLSIAIGYASGIADENLDLILRTADQRMYLHKNETKKIQKQID